MSDSNIIKIEARLSRVLFPKYPEVLGRDNTYGIVSWTPMLVLEGDVETDLWGNIIVKGHYEEEIDYKKDYTIMAKEVIDPQRGKQYELLFIGHILDLSKVHNQKAFLKTFLTDNQISEMFKVLENPLATIESHDIESLKKVNGIGDYIANCIIERFENNKDNCEVYVELDGYGLTPKFIQKLIKEYKNPHAVVEIVKNNPYKLSLDIEGIGFRTADAIALKSGISETSSDRVKAYINYILDDLGKNGNSFITSGELTAYIYEEFGGKDNIVEVYLDENNKPIGNNIGKAMDELQAEDIIILEDNENKVNRRVYLKKYYDLEKKIADHLKRIAQAENHFDYTNWEEIITLQENKQGWRFTDEQKAGIKLGLDNQVCFIAGGAGCVDCDTEFFNGTKWKKISEYDEETDLVLQYHEEGHADLVKPIRYIKEKAEVLNFLHNKSNSVNQVLCDDHNVYYHNSVGQSRKIKCKDLKEIHQKSKWGFSGRFLTTFDYEGNGINLSEFEIRVMIAVIADGTFAKDSNYCRINIKKTRKQERLEYLLDKANISYKKSKGDSEGFFKYYFYPPRKEKEFTSYWYNCSKEQFQIIIDEVTRWDGSKRYNDNTPYYIFCSSNKNSIDFIQFAYASCGIRTSISMQDRIGAPMPNPIYKRKSLEYVLNISSVAKKVGIQARRVEDKCEITPYKTIDGYKYCFTVPSNLLVLRREGRIFITGNCGKTSTLGGMLAALGYYEGKCTVAQAALSGKAAARMTEVTGKEGFTIHRLLKYTPNKGFEHNEDNPLPYDIIILDEISLVGGEIFLSLIQAIAEGTKLIILGDMGQLESIGCMNLAFDMYNSEFVTTVELTKVHRQAQKSGIITASQQIRRGEPVLPKNFVGETIVGELQDMIFDISDSTDTIRQRVFKWFKDKYENSEYVKDIMDIQILSPCKDRGDASVFNLNMDIQAFVNPPNPSKKEIKVNISKDKSYYLREGDKVMCIKNNYKIRGRKREGVYNGWCGVLKKIDEWSGLHEVYIPMIDDTMIFSTNDLVNGVSLSYASTVHKYQGSSAPIIIGVFDYTTPPNMRTKELLYTLWTRAEKECIMVAQNSAMYYAASESGVSDKNTFLLELLDNE